MHIPDNYLSPATCAVLGAAMVPVWTVAVRKVRRELPKAGVPLLGIAAAFSFLVMMFNVPLPGGSTGHAVGAALLAVTLGPWAACLSISIALLLQALMFGDGGILAFGANAFNMAFVMPFLGYFVWRVVRDLSPRGRGEIAGLVAGSYVSFAVAALLVGIELGVQPLFFRDASGVPLYFPYPLSVSVPAMLVPHLAVAGVADALFAAAVFAFLRRVSPGSIYQAARSRTRVLSAVLVGLACLTPVGMLASGKAWGEWGVATIRSMIGYVPRGMQKGFTLPGLFPGYLVRGFPDVLGYTLSAVAGSAVLVIVFKLIGLAWAERRRKSGAQAPKLNDSRLAS